MFLARRVGVKITSKFCYYTSSAIKLINVTTDDDSGYVTVTLNRPPANSLNFELLNEFSTLLTNFQCQNPRGMILTSSLETIFSAGFDLMELSNPKEDRVKMLYTKFQDVWMQLYGTTYPTVAVVNGHAPAAGCILAASCEYRIMLKNYVIGFNEVKFGLTAADWVMKLLETIIGRRQAEYAFITGQLFTADEAHQVGLVDEIGVNKQDALKRAEAFLNKYEMISQLSRSQSKKYFRSRDIEEFKNNRKQDAEAFVSRIENPLMQQNFQSYLASLKNKNAK